MSEKLVVVLNVTGEYEAETIDISLIEMYISPSHIPLIVFNRPSKTTQVRILNFDLMNLPNFPCR